MNVSNINSLPTISSSYTSPDTAIAQTTANVASTSSRTPTAQRTRQIKTTSAAQQAINSSTSTAKQTAKDKTTPPAQQTMGNRSVMLNFPQILSSQQQQQIPSSSNSNGLQPLSIQQQQMLATARQQLIQTAATTTNNKGLSSQTSSFLPPSSIPNTHSSAHSFKQQQREPLSSSYQALKSYDQAHTRDDYWSFLRERICFYKERLSESEKNQFSMFVNQLLTIDTPPKNLQKKHLELICKCWPPTYNHLRNQLSEDNSENLPLIIQATNEPHLPIQPPFMPISQIKPIVETYLFNLSVEIAKFSPTMELQAFLRKPADAVFQPDTALQYNFLPPISSSTSHPLSSFLSTQPLPSVSSFTSSSSSSLPASSSHPAQQLSSSFPLASFFSTSSSLSSFPSTQPLSSVSSFTSSSSNNNRTFSDIPPLELDPLTNLWGF